MANVQNLFSCLKLLSSVLTLRYKNIREQFLDRLKQCERRSVVESSRRQFFEDGTMVTGYEFSACDNPMMSMWMKQKIRLEVRYWGNLLLELRELKCTVMECVEKVEDQLDISINDVDPYTQTLESWTDSLDYILDCLKELLDLSKLSSSSVKEGMPVDAFLEQMLVNDQISNDFYKKLEDIMEQSTLFIDTARDYLQQYYAKK